MAKFRNIPLNPFASNPRVRTTIYIPPVDSHLKPHADQIAKEVRLVETAREEGVANRPHKDDRDLNEAQQKIIARVEEGANLLCQFGLNQMNRALARVRALMPTAMDTGLTLAAVDGDIIQVKVGLRDALEAARGAVRLALSRLRKFRRDHEIGNRKAEYADNILWPTAVLLALLVLETGVNALLFQNANPLGYVGGFGQAALFGLVNVGLGFFFGFLCLRLLAHVRTGIRVLGVILGTILLPLGIAWSLIVANYRQALQANPDASFLDMSRLSAPSEWLHITTAESWALLLLGILIYTLAALKGRGGEGGFWDVYLGFKPVDLAYREADAAYSGLKDELRAAIHGAILKAREDLRAAYNAEGDAVRQIQEISAQAEERADEVCDSVSEWTRMGVALIAKYREENIAVRTDDAPAYFEDTPKMPVVDRKLPSAAAVRHLADRASKIHQDNAAVLVDAEKKIADLLAQEAEIFIEEIEEVEKRADEATDRKWEADETSDRPPQAETTDRDEEQHRSLEPELD